MNGTNVGPTLDQYSNTEVFQEFAIGNLTFGTTGNFQFQFMVTGKNASSSGYTLAFDYINLTQSVGM